MNKVSTIIFLVVNLSWIGCADRIGDLDLEQGATYYMKGDLEQAEEKLKTALDKELVNHTSSEAYTMLGNVFSEQGKQDSAIIYHKMAIELDSSYEDAWINLGKVYLLDSRFRMAQMCYNEALKLNPDNPELYAYLGSLYIAKREPHRAITYLAHAIELDPQLDVAHANYALAMAMVGDFESAREELHKAIAMGYQKGEVIEERIVTLEKAAPKQEESEGPTE